MQRRAFNPRSPIPTRADKWYSIAMNEWWSERWLRRHALAAPFGVFAATALLTYLHTQGQAQPRELTQTAAGFVDLGAVLYGMVAVVIEKGITLMFWALEQRQKRQKAFRDEIASEIRQDVVAQAEREIFARLGPIAKDKGISEDELRQAFSEVRSNAKSKERDNKNK